MKIPNWLADKFIKFAKKTEKEKSDAKFKEINDRQEEAFRIKDIVDTIIEGQFNKFKDNVKPLFKVGDKVVINFLTSDYWEGNTRLNFFNTIFKNNPIVTIESVTIDYVYYRTKLDDLIENGNLNYIKEDLFLMYIKEFIGMSEDYQKFMYHYKFKAEDGTVYTLGLREDKLGLLNSLRGKDILILYEVESKILKLKNKQDDLSIQFKETLTQEANLKIKISNFKTY